VNADRESTNVTPEFGGGVPRATADERPAAVEGPSETTTAAAPVRPQDIADEEWEAAVLGVSPDKRRLSLETALVGFFGFPILAVILFFAALASPAPQSMVFVCTAALALTFVVLLAKRKFSLALGGIAGIVAFVLFLLGHCGLL